MFFLSLVVFMPLLGIFGADFRFIETSTFEEFQEEVASCMEELIGDTENIETKPSFYPYNNREELENALRTKSQVHRYLNEIRNVARRSFPRRLSGEELVYGMNKRQRHVTVMHRESGANFTLKFDINVHHGTVSIEDSAVILDCTEKYVILSEATVLEKAITVGHRILSSHCRRPFMLVTSIQVIESALVKLWVSPIAFVDVFPNTRIDVMYLPGSNDGDNFDALSGQTRRYYDQKYLRLYNSSWNYDWYRTKAKDESIPLGSSGFQCQDCYYWFDAGLKYTIETNWGSLTEFELGVYCDGKAHILVAADSHVEGNGHTDITLLNEYRVATLHVPLFLGVTIPIHFYFGLGLSLDWQFQFDKEIRTEMEVVFNKPEYTYLYRYYDPPFNGISNNVHNRISWKWEKPKFDVQAHGNITFTLLPKLSLKPFDSLDLWIEARPYFTLDANVSLSTISFANSEYGLDLAYGIDTDVQICNYDMASIFGLPRNNLINVIGPRKVPCNKLFNGFGVCNDEVKSHLDDVSACSVESTYFDNCKAFDFGTGDNYVELNVLSYDESISQSECTIYGQDFPIARDQSMLMIVWCSDSCDITMGQVDSWDSWDGETYSSTIDGASYRKILYIKEGNYPCVFVDSMTSNSELKVEMTNNVELNELQWETGPLTLLPQSSGSISWFGFYRDIFSIHVSNLYGTASRVRMIVQVRVFIDVVEVCNEPGLTFVTTDTHNELLFDVSQIDGCPDDMSFDTYHVSLLIHTYGDPSGSFFSYEVKLTGIEHASFDEAVIIDSGGFIRTFAFATKSESSKYRLLWAAENAPTKVYEDSHALNPSKEISVERSDINIGSDELFGDIIGPVSINSTFLLVSISSFVGVEFTINPIIELSSILAGKTVAGVFDSRNDIFIYRYDCRKNELTHPKVFLSLHSFDCRFSYAFIRHDASWEMLFYNPNDNGPISRSDITATLDKFMDGPYEGTELYIVFRWSPSPYPYYDGCNFDFEFFATFDNIRSPTIFDIYSGETLYFRPSNSNRLVYTAEGDLQTDQILNILSNFVPRDLFFTLPENLIDTMSGSTTSRFGSGVLDYDVYFALQNPTAWPISIELTYATMQRCDVNVRFSDCTSDGVNFHAIKNGGCLNLTLDISSCDPANKFNLFLVEDEILQGLLIDQNVFVGGTWWNELVSCFNAELSSLIDMYNMKDVAWILEISYYKVVVMFPVCVSMLNQPGKTETVTVTQIHPMLMNSLLSSHDTQTQFLATSFEIKSPNDCPSNCNGNGDCFDGICSCHPGNYGEDCSCLIDCRNSLCSNGQCICSPGLYYGKDCSCESALIQCASVTNSDGYCENNVCGCISPFAWNTGVGDCSSCISGIYGNDCTCSTATIDCITAVVNGDGTCENNICGCVSPWAWNDIASDCSNCMNGHFGNDCSCTVDCSALPGNNECSNGVCECQTHWYGVDCTCDTDCSLEGKVCSSGKCIQVECPTGTFGEDCSCSVDCSAMNEHTECSSGICVCSDPWQGQDCSCDFACDSPGSSGNCTAGKCQCLENWDGIMCDRCEKENLSPENDCKKQKKPKKDSKNVGVAVSVSVVVTLLLLGFAVVITILAIIGVFILVRKAKKKTGDVEMDAIDLDCEHAVEPSKNEVEDEIQNAE